MIVATTSTLQDDCILHHAVQVLVADPELCWRGWTYAEDNRRHGKPQDTPMHLIAITRSHQTPPEVWIAPYTPMVHLILSRPQHVSNDKCVW